MFRQSQKNTRILFSHCGGRPRLTRSTFQQHGGLLIEHLVRLTQPLTPQTKTGTRSAAPPIYAGARLGLSVGAVKESERLVWDAIDFAVAGERPAAEAALGRAIAKLQGSE